MVVTIDIQEGEPGACPSIGADIDPAQAAIAWRRVEGWIGWRWGVRPVAFVLEGAGEWAPPLVPLAEPVAATWCAGAWAAITPPAGPLGGFLFDTVGPHRVEALLGSAEPPPEMVREAVRRLAHYNTELAGQAAELASTRRTSIAGALDIESTADPRLLARALTYSGAADLLRPWRKLGAGQC